MSPCSVSVRTNGETSKAVRVIHRALDSGINYFDTAPAYASSRDYYGAALGERRQQVRGIPSRVDDRQPLLQLVEGDPALDQCLLQAGGGALTVRVGLSIGLIIVLFVLNKLGIISPN